MTAAPIALVSIEGDVLALDLKQLQSPDRDVLLEPRDIFDSLPNKPWTRLRLEQGEILQKWFDNRNRRDNVLKQNTGGGKTVIGLLIAQSSINEGVGPAVYLVPDTYLVEQVLSEAERLGIACTSDANDVRFRTQRAILVTTFHKLVNGRSVFGVRGSRPTVKLGTVVIDDAHAALNAAKDSFTVKIPRSHDAYDQIVKLFAADLKQQSPRVWADIKAQDYSAPIRIPFWSWISHQDDVLSILRAAGEDSSAKSIYFPWPLVADSLHLAVATVTSRTIEIRTACPDIGMIPAFDEAERRVYLTATLADDGILVTDLDADPENVRNPLTPGRAADLGDRLILAPQEINPLISDQSIRSMARQFADGVRDGGEGREESPINVVVVVPSDAAAKAWADLYDVKCDVNTLKPIVHRLKRGEKVGLVVLVNKYDGVDLPYDACRLLILDGVPSPLDAAESREATALSGSNTFLARKVQRIEQGMGRGIRDASDHCAVLLIGYELAVTIVDPVARQYFSPATRAQLELSEQLASLIQGKGMDSIREAVDVFLKRDPDWTSISSRARAGVKYDADGHVEELAIARRRAFDLASAGNHALAADSLQEALRPLSGKERGWYGEEVASYLHAVDSQKAQAVLGQARRDNPAALLPLVAVPVRPLKPVGMQATAVAQHLKKYSTATHLVLEFNNILSGLRWDENGSDAAEQAMEDIGLHLGFASDRPDNLYKTGPDNLWAINTDSHIAFELKTEVTRDDKKIWKHEIDQLSGHVSWHRTNYPGVKNLVPVMVHPCETLHEQGSAPPNCRYMGDVELTAFKQDLLNFVRAISQNDGWKSEAEIAKQLTIHKLTVEAAVLAHTKPLRNN